MLLEALTSSLLVNGLASFLFSKPHLHLHHPYLLAFKSSTLSSIVCCNQLSPVSPPPSFPQMNPGMKTHSHGAQAQISPMHHITTLNSLLGRQLTQQIEALEDPLSHSVPTKLWGFGFCGHVQVTGSPHTGLGWAACLSHHYPHQINMCTQQPPLSILCQAPC